MKAWLIAILGIMLASGCTYAARIDGPYEGKVIDADTKEPIEGVVILGVWYTAQFSPAGSTHNFYDARETVTDRNGQFSIRGMGLRVLSNLDPMHVTIFKAGYEYLHVPWESLKEDILLRDRIKWEGKKAIIPIKKLSMEERKKQGSPSDPPDKAPLNKVRLFLREMDKDSEERGLPTRNTWGGKKI